MTHDDDTFELQTKDEVNRETTPSSLTNERAVDVDPKQPQRTPGIGDYIRVFSYATKWDFCIYAVASFASIGAGITLPLMNIIMGQLVGQFTDQFRESSTVSRDAFERILNQQALYIMGLFIARWGLNSINKFCFRMIGIRLSSAVRLHYLRSLFAQSIHAIDSMPAGAPATAITTTSNTLQVGISERLGTFLEFNGTIWSALIVAFVWSWDITLVTSSLILYLIVVLSVCLPLELKSQTEISQANAQGTAVASEALQGIRLVMACGAQSRILSRYEKWVKKAMKAGQKTAPVLGMQFGLIVSICSYITQVERAKHGLVLWHLRGFRASLLVWGQEICFWCDRQSRSHFHRSHVGYDDSHGHRTYSHTPPGRQQSYGSCMRVLRCHRCSLANFRLSEARHYLLRHCL